MCSLRYICKYSIFKVILQCSLLNICEVINVEQNKKKQSITVL